MKIKTEIVNPERAKQYLEKNLNNRNLRPRIVTFFADQMSKGIWLEDNGDTIRISKSGVLLDGQHRLSAIVKSGISLKLTIAYDIVDNAFEFIDIGTARHAGDVLSISGVKKPNVMASIIKDYNGLKHGVSSGQKTIRLSNHEVLEIYKTDPEKYDFISKKAMHLYSSFNGVVTPSVLGSYYLYLKDYSAKRVDEFFEKLCTGANIDIDDPIMILRNKLLFYKTQPDKSMSTAMRYAFIVKTWNNYLRGKKTKRLVCNDDHNPKPYSN
jgi:hypothetical protein